MNILRTKHAKGVISKAGAKVYSSRNMISPILTFLVPSYSHFESIGKNHCMTNRYKINNIEDSYHYRER